MQVLKLSGYNVVATRIFQRGINHILTERPFQNGPGAKLYVAAGEPTDIVYRPARAFDPKHLPLLPVLTRDMSVATCDKPVAELTYELPPELIGVPLSCQIRTFADDYENETIYLPVTTGSDGGGNQSDLILGTAQFLEASKRDAGGVVIIWNYVASTLGIQPEEFALVQIAGPGSLPDTIVTAFVGYNLAEIDGLADAATYEWRLEGRNGSVVADLGSVSFTADAAGPAGTIMLSIVAE